MTSSLFWTQLQQAGARLHGEHCHFDNLPENRETVVTPLRQYGFIRAVGPDGQTFLQGQTTADFRQVTLAQARAGSYCTAKGRMIANFLAARYAEDGLLLRARRDSIDHTLATLAKYAVFSKVTLTDDSDQTVALGIDGPEAKSALQAVLGAAPDSVLAATKVDRGLIIQCDEAAERFELWLDNDAAMPVWQALAEHCDRRGSEYWDELGIRDGFADVCAATREAFLPQMLNYDLTGAVNFKKGCYTGQEVVARLHFKGKAKRRLYSATIAGNAAPGDDIYRGEGTQAVGTVACVTSSGAAGVVLATQSAQDTSLRLKDGSAISHIAPPPYGLDE